MKRKRVSTLPSWWPSFFIALVMALIAFLLVYRLGTLVPGLSEAELVNRADSNSIHHIINDPINAPYKVPVYVLLHFKHQGALALRGVAAIYGFITVVVFYYILKRWQSGRIAVFGVLLFGTSSWFLHTARFGGPDVLFFGLLTLVAAGLWLRRTQHRALALYICVVIIAISFYIPGLIWFALAGIIWRRRAIADEMRHVTWWHFSLCVIFFVILIAPLGYASFLHPALALTALGLPQTVPKLTELFHNFIHIPLFVFFRAPSLQPANWLGLLPILDAFEIAMFGLGVYAYARYWRLDRAGLLFGIIVLGIVLITLGGPVTMSSIVPFIYLIIAGGITYMMHEWFSIFPLNPVARTVGVSLMFLVILVSCGYQLDRYFIAWADSPATVAVYSQHLLQ